MKEKQNGFWLKLITYFVLSYAVSVLSIVLMLSFPKEADSSNLISNIFNIIFSTNACFVFTTGWSVRKHSHPLAARAHGEDLVYSAITLGVLVSGVMLTVSTLKDEVPLISYLVVAVITAAPCVYLAWIYIEETLKKEKIIEQHEGMEYLKKATEYQQTKNETSFDIGGVEYKM